MKWRLALKPQTDRDINNQFEYIAKEKQVEILRVLHASRNIDNIFGDEGDETS
jgi:plasmid stabilization system protein ParE